MLLLMWRRTAGQTWPNIPHLCPTHLHQCHDHPMNRPHSPACMLALKLGRMLGKFPARRAAANGARLVRLCNIIALVGLFIARLTNGRKLRFLGGNFGKFESWKLLIGGPLLCQLFQLAQRSDVSAYAKRAPESSGARKLLVLI